MSFFHHTDGQSSPLNLAATVLSSQNKQTRTDLARHLAEGRLAGNAKYTPIIAVCHLSWSWVWQRPQQFLSRLAKTHPLLFVETHCSDVTDSEIVRKLVDGHANIQILEMHFPADRWHDGEFIDLERRRLLQRAIADTEGAFDRAILWINDPMSVTAFAGHLGESMIVYDCMDELSQFSGAPPSLIGREKKLTSVADVIFCGGRKMRDKRLPINGNCHFYGTGVDCRHFGRAMDPDLPVHPDIASLPGPVLGYFGVIDERIDYALLERLADAEPSWSIAMIGPFAKIDPATLPKRKNLHWLGGKAYEELPSLTKGMDVCMMPFALNAATEFINPTKALEYMAAGRPVVATCLDEIKSNFSEACAIANDHNDFIELCRNEIRSPSARKICKGLRLASENTWEVIVAKMDAHIKDALLVRAPELQMKPAGVLGRDLSGITQQYV
jgi:glycosyltransferase involved in cell wall biosynthesis